MSTGPGLVWSSGRFLEPSQAAVPASSPTPIQGPGAYESLRIVNGVAPLLHRHVKRLREACRWLGLSGVDQDWGRILAELSRRRGLPDARARITIGRGFALASCDPLPADMERERTEGVALVAHPVRRATPWIKSVSRGPLQAAEREAGGEVLLQDAEGRWLETSRANLFVWLGNELWTAPQPRVLPGIARAVTLELCQERAIRIRQSAPEPALVDAAAEVFVTNAIRGVRPVRSIDGKSFRTSERTRQIQRALDARMQLCDAPDA